MEYQATEIEESAPPQRHRIFTWPALLALGWLIYELTAQPNLGVAIVCAKFGWDDFRTALWLRSRDTHPGRGWACFWFYLASGLWVMAITATIAIFAVGFLTGIMVHWLPNALPPGQPRGNPMPPWLPGACLTALLGFLLSTLTTCVALWLGWRHGVRFWLSGSVHRFRARDLWPPFHADWVPMNQAGRLFLTALVVLIVPTVITLSILAGTALAAFGPVPILTVVFLMMGVGPIIILGLRDVLNRNFVAPVPWQCWTRDDPEQESTWATESS